MSEEHNLQEHALIATSCGSYFYLLIIIELRFCKHYYTFILACIFTIILDYKVVATQSPPIYPDDYYQLLPV